MAAAALATTLLHAGAADKASSPYDSAALASLAALRDDASNPGPAEPDLAQQVAALQRGLARYSLQEPLSPAQHSFPAQEDAGLSPSPGATLRAPPVAHNRTASVPPTLLPQREGFARSPESDPKSAPLKQDLLTQAESARRKLKSTFRGLADDVGGGEGSGSETEGSSRDRMRHSRRASFMPGIDIGTGRLSAAPPAERPISVSIRPLSISDHPGTQTGLFDVSPASLALARTNSLSSQGSVHGLPNLHTPAMPMSATDSDVDAIDTYFMPQSPVPPPPQSPGGSTSENAEPDTHPLYTLLSKSGSDRLRAAWLAARLVLVPPRESLPPDFADWSIDDLDDPEEEHSWQEWVASHAFKPTEEDCAEGQERFVSASSEICLEATVDAVLNEVHLTEASEMALAQQRAASGGHAGSPPPVTVQRRLAASMPASPPSHTHSPLSTARPHTSQGLRRSLQVTSEMVVYRQRAAKTSAATVRPSSTPTGKKEKRGMKPSRWFRAASKSKIPPGSASSETTLPEPYEEPMLDRIKLLSVGGEVVPWHRGGYKPSDDAAKLQAVTEERSLLRDLEFFQQPPEALSEFAQVLRTSIEDLARSVQEFASAFLHVWGYETYTLKRIRSKIIDPVWRDHLHSVARLDAMLFQRLENVVMGLCHEHLYTRVILPQHEPKNRYLDTVLAIYRGRPLTLEDFGLALPSDLDLRHAFAMLRSLNGGSGVATPSALDLEWLTSLLGDVDLVAALLRARTPLDLLTRLHGALEALSQAVNAHSMFGLTVDDYIPLLSFALVHADVKDLESLSYYMKAFVQSDLSPELLWSQTTFDAAVAFLRTDPFFAEVARPPSTVATPATEVPPSRSDMRMRRVSTMSMTSGPVLTVHQTSSPPRRSPSTTSLPSVGTETTSPTLPVAHDFLFRADDTMLSPTRVAASSLFSRRVHSGKKVPSEIADGIDFRSRRRLSASDEGVGHRSGRRSGDVMPPPSFPASAGMARNRSTASMDAQLAEELAARLDHMLPNASSVVLQPPTPEVEIRPQIILRSTNLARQPSRSYHMAVDFESDPSGIPMRSSRAPLGRTGSHHLSDSSQGSATDMRRSRSEGLSKSTNVDAWLLGRSPASERSVSPRSSSPSSVGLSLQRTLSIGSEINESDVNWAWNRHRLSSASSSSLHSSDGLSRRNSQTDSAARTRKNSVSAADVLNRLHSSTSAIDTSQPRASFAARRQSTLSMSSVDSTETFESSGTSAAPTSPPTLLLSMSHRKRQSSARLMRRDLLAGPSPLAPRQDNTNVISLPISHGRFSSWTDMPSPIKEHHSRDSSPVSARAAVFDPGSHSPSPPLSPPWE